MIKQKKKAWSGRFDKKTDPLMENFNASIPFDHKLYKEDIEASVAHVKMLNKINILTDKEAKKIQKGLESIRCEIHSGNFFFSPVHEDIHMSIESRLFDKIGKTAGKLHTARSRNDQVACDLRLYCKKELKNIFVLVNNLQKAIINLAKKKGFVVLPGYTHLQRAQPIYWAHQWLAYFEMLERDKERIRGAYVRADSSPLGSGALSGSTISVNREFVAQELHFSGITHNSLDSVSDRDFVLEALFCLSMIQMHLSRLSEELILWSSQEFGFVELPQEFCTGSSMMPQKINPDAPELIRGKTGRVYGNLLSLLTVMKGLPLSYNKDLQEDKEPLFDSLDTVSASLKILARMIPEIEAKPFRMRKATEEGFLLATDLAEYLATKGVEFRRAHEIVGKLVSTCLQEGKVLEQLTLKELQKFSSHFNSDAADILNVEASLQKRKSLGGTARECVQRELKRAGLLVRKTF